MPTTDISSILEFRNHLRACTSCDLSSNCTGPVPWRGDVNPTFAIMGEAPGRTEDARGQPFVGDSGAILSHWLKNTGFDLSAITFFNAVQCYPRRTPTNEEIAACRGWMHGQLEFIRPQVLITMGKVAYSSIRGGIRHPELKVIHGKPLFHPVYQLWIWPTYHPSAYLHGRNAVYEKKIVTDLTRLHSWWDNQEGALDICYLCGDELYRYESWGIGLCHRHASIQGELFTEDQ